MTQVTLTNLVAKLSPELKRALEASAGTAMNQGVAAIEPEHWLLTLLNQQDVHLKTLIESQKINQDQLASELANRIERLPKVQDSQPTLSHALTELLKDAWMIASVNYGHGEIISLHLVQALLQQNVMGVSSNNLESLQNVSTESLQGLINKTPVKRATQQSTGEASSAANTASANDALSKYTINLTQQAIEGNIDPISGRNSEVRKAIDILCRKRQNNPIFVGEPGVGKTAVVEGLALRIAADEVPSALQGVQLHSLDLGLLQAGASVKGEFENRLKDVINEVKNSDVPIIVFIDEAHTLIGAGGAAGQNDAANLLKPALARGEFKTIAATTWAEYKKYFEKDPALTRRFQVVTVEEPNAEDAKQMLRGIAASLQKHHGAFITESAIDAAVNLSIRYLPSRQLPDKAISLLDTASARIALTQGAKPEVIEALEQTIRYQQNEQSALEKEFDLFGTGAEEIAELKQEITTNQSQLADYQTRWEQEITLVDEIKALQQSITESETPDEAQQTQLNALLDQLHELQAKRR